MTVLDSVPAPAWQLSPVAKSMIKTHAVSLAELFRVLTATRDVIRVPVLDPPGAIRHSAFGLSVVEHCGTVLAVSVDTNHRQAVDADAGSLRAWTRDRPEFAELVPDVRPPRRWVPRHPLPPVDDEPDEPMPVSTRRVPPARTPAPVTSQPLIRPALAPRPAPVAAAPCPVDDGSDVLLRIHPALRASVTQQAAGDFSRVVVHSPTKVSINPL